MPRLAICSGDLHWHWINRTLLCDTMEVSMLSRAWLTIAQHVFQPVLTGRPELISRKIVSRELGPRCYRDFAKNIALLGAKKMGSNMRPRYTRPRYIGLTLYWFIGIGFLRQSSKGNFTGTLIIPVPKMMGFILLKLQPHLTRTTEWSKLLWMQYYCKCFQIPWVIGVIWV